VSHLVSGNTACALSKDGVIVTMEKVLSSMGLTQSAKLGVAISIMAQLSKNSKFLYKKPFPHSTPNSPMG